jgi:hypothetical protein
VSKRRKPNRPLNPAHVVDPFLDTLRTECARAAVEYLRAGVNVQRPIASLTKRELEGLAEAVTARWIVLVSQRIEELPAERGLLLAHDPGPVPDEYLGFLL